MTAVPTPEEFLAQTEPEEDDEPVQHSGLMIQSGLYSAAFVIPPNPLESIAESLGMIAATFQHRQHKTDLNEAAESGYLELKESYADLEDKHRVLFELLEEIEAIVKPSTSKLANSVRDAITAWRSPEVPEPSSLGEPYTDAEIAALRERPIPGIDQPANDADVEEWRAYARSRVHPDQAADLEQMNRSQIRTMLGIPQVEA